MTKKRSEEELFSKAVELAISEGRSNNPEIVDPLRSGQKFDMFLLLSKEGKR